MGISESSTKNIKKILFAVVSGIAKGLINEGLKKIGAGEVASEVYGNVIDAVSDSADSKLSGWLENLYEDKKLSSRIEQIYKSEIDDLINANETYSEMPSLVEFASSKSDTAVFKEDIVNSIDEWRNFITKENRSAPSISNEEIKKFLDKLYRNIEYKMAADSDLQIFWNVIRNIRKSEEIQETLNVLKEQGKSIHDMLTSLYNKQEYIKDHADEYFKNYYSPLCVHREEVENRVTLKDVFVMPDVEIDNETKRLDEAVKEFIKNNAHEAMLLLGHGGFGKTSFVSYMAANKYYFCENRPLYIIRLREYSKSSIDNLCDDIADSDKRSKISKNAVIVFDGLDELCMIAGGNGEDKAAKIIDKLVKQFYDYAGNDKRKIIITSRPGFVNQGDKIKDIEIDVESVNLVQANYVSFDKIKRDEFVEKIEKADIRLTESNKKAGCDYIRSIEESDKISDIYSSPFILYLICCVQIKDIKIEPSKIGNSWYLFRKIFHDLYMKSLYKDRNYNADREDYFHNNKEKIYEKTCEFAFEMYKKSLGKDDVIRLDDNDEEFDGFKECYALSCYFNKKNDGVIEFSHNYIRDFFICEYILKELNKVIGGGEFTEEKGRIVADWCRENLYNTLIKHYDDNKMILDFIEAHFQSNDNIYMNFNFISNDNISYVFNKLAEGEKYIVKTSNMMNNDQNIYSTPLRYYLENIIENIQEIFYRYFKYKTPNISIKWLTRNENKYVLDGLKLYGADMTELYLADNDVVGREYDSKTLFRNNFDPQAHGMIYVIKEKEISEKLSSIPILLRRQMKIKVSNDKDIFSAIKTESAMYVKEPYKYDPIKNALIDIKTVCMTPDDKDSVININTVCEGETIRFGNYEWIILKADIKTRKMLVLSKSRITYLPFNDKDELVTWKNCSLRNWLNNEFIKEFSNLERKHIIEAYVEGVNDKIFLLSKQEYYDYYEINRNNLIIDRYLSRTINVEDNKMIDLYPNKRANISQSIYIYPVLWIKF